MAVELELSSLDLRYEGHRMKNAGLEERLLATILQRGLEEPLEGVEVDGAHILLNGFKRYRCARKLQLPTVPYASLGQDEAAGILSLLRTSNNRALSILEQAAFIDELHATRNLTVAQIAQELSRSKAWVSMRLGLIAEMSATIRAKLFSGAFPVYPYMYTLRQFMRMNGVKLEQIEQFVTAVSNHGLSVREIEQLAHGFFRGPDSFRQEILKGNLALPLKQLRQVDTNVFNLFTPQSGLSHADPPRPIEQGIDTIIEEAAEGLRDLVRGLGLSGIGIDLHDSTAQNYYDHPGPGRTRLLQLFLWNVGTIEDAFWENQT